VFLIKERFNVSFFYVYFFRLPDFWTSRTWNVRNGGGNYFFFNIKETY